MAVSKNPNIKQMKWEYTQFLEFVKQRKPQRALIYAKALGIDRRTLRNWMSQQELRDAMAESVDELLTQMQEAGKEDWRMWRDMLKMSGIDDEQTVEVKVDDTRKQILEKYGLGNAGQDKEA